MFDDATTRVVNPSSATGGTLRLVTSDDWDSLDPGNTYRTFAWNFARLFGRTLVTYRDAPGRRRASSSCPTSRPDWAPSPTTAGRSPTRCARA